MTLQLGDAPTRERQNTSPDLGSELVPFAHTEITPEAVDAAVRVLRSGWVTTGPEVCAFEAEFAAWVATDNAVAVSSCTAGLELALRSLMLPAGSKVLLSTLTFCGAAHAVVHAGLQPVLADIDPATLMPSAATVAQASARAGGVRAMVVVHLGGHAADVEALAEAAGLGLDRVVEDAAHAVGTSVAGRHIGNKSRACCYSFYATKNLPIGEGGMVTSSDPDVAAFVREARLHGMSSDAWRRYLPGGSWRYSVRAPGLKANMTDLQAAIGRAQLRHLVEWQARRRDLAARYDERLAALTGLLLPPRPVGGGHAWHLYAVRLLTTDRDAAIEALAAAGIGTSVHFIPLHHLPYFLQMCPESGLLTSADEVASQLLSLPLHPALRDEQVDRVCDQLATHLQHRHSSGSAKRTLS